MVTPTAGEIVLVPFPFSDLSQSKLRPALVLCDVGRGDFVLAQITSKPYGDPDAILVNNADLATGSLRFDSFVRPGKLFTANTSLFVSVVAELHPGKFGSIIDAVIDQFRPAT